MKNCIRSGVLLATLLATAISMGGTAEAAELGLTAGATGSTSATVHVKSFHELKFSSTVHQERDYSCGSAALATLLTYGYGISVTETSVLEDMIKHGNKKRIKKYGFSLLDMKNYLARHDLQSGGFRAPLAKLAQVGVPAVVLIDHDKYKHFVIVRGIKDGRVLLSDPSIGMRAVSVQQFDSEWNDIFFLVLTDASVAQKTFNNQRLWAAAPRAPIDLARFEINLMSPLPGGIPSAGTF